MSGFNLCPNFSLKKIVLLSQSDIVFKSRRKRKEASNDKGKEKEKLRRRDRERGKGSEEEMEKGIEGRKGGGKGGRKGRRQIEEGFRGNDCPKSSQLKVAYGNFMVIFFFIRNVLPKKVTIFSYCQLK